MYNPYETSASIVNVILTSFIVNVILMSFHKLSQFTQKRLDVASAPMKVDSRTKFFPIIFKLNYCSITHYLFPLQHAGLPLAVFSWVRPEAQLAFVAVALGLEAVGADFTGAVGRGEGAARDCRWD